MPQTEAWLILEATCRWSTTDAAGSVKAGLRSRSTFIGSFNWPMSEQGFETGAAVTRGGCSVLDHPFWVQPGEIIEVMIWGIIGAALSTVLVPTLRLVRFRI